ncbi:MAG: ABC transporter substrate-binding protein [Planctomycetota bacterium]
MHLLVPLLCALLAACGGSPTPAADPSSAPPVAGFPLVLESANGRSARLERPARRVLAGNAGALDLLLAIADEERVGGINAGTRPYSVAMRDAAVLADAPLLKTFDMESIATLDPDLVLTHGWQTMDKGPFLERMSIPVLELGESDSLDAIALDLERLGRALDVRERAAAVVEDLRARAAVLAEVDRSQLEAMTLSGGDGGSWSAGSGTTAAFVIELAGLTHLTSARGLEGHFQLDHEQLLELDPEVLVVPSDDGTLAGSSTWRAIESDARLAGLRVRSDAGQVVPIDALLLGTTSHHLIDAAEALAAAIDAP